MATEVNTANAIGLTGEGCSRVTLWITTAFHLDTPIKDLILLATFHITGSHVGLIYIIRISLSLLMIP